MSGVVAACAISLPTRFTGLALCGDAACGGGAGGFELQAANHTTTMPSAALLFMAGQHSSRVWGHGSGATIGDRRRPSAVIPFLHRQVVQAAVLACAATGCATRSSEVVPQRTDPAEFVSWSCERIDEECDRVQLRAADVAYAVDARSGNNMIALGFGVTVFWPALLAMRPDGIEAQELAALKGRYEALRAAARQRVCPPPPEAMSAQRAAKLPLAPGERFVYEERANPKAPPQELGLRVLALKRDRIEFAADMGGQALPGTWSQDLAGNSQADNRVAADQVAPAAAARHATRPGAGR